MTEGVLRSLTDLYSVSPATVAVKATQAAVKATLQRLQPQRKPEELLRISTVATPAVNSSTGTPIVDLLWTPYAVAADSIAKDAVKYAEKAIAVLESPPMTSPGGTMASIDEMNWKSDRMADILHVLMKNYSLIFLGRVDEVLLMLAGIKLAIEEADKASGSVRKSMARIKKVSATSAVATSVSGLLLLVNRQKLLKTTSQSLLDR
jgi:acetaldehyde dehydrogenase (acetylating)